jgi:hypothetical protein
MFPTRFANIVWNPRFVKVFDFHVEVSEIGMQVIESLGNLGYDVSTINV